ncbi:MAG: hypothetical protein R2855_13420 [Thermomicrobiales bacterium]
MPADQSADVFVGHAAMTVGLAILIPVEMEDREHCRSRAGFRKILLPSTGQRSGFRLAIADHRRHQQIGIVERRPKAD